MKSSVADARPSSGFQERRPGRAPYIDPRPVSRVPNPREIPSTFATKAPKRQVVLAPAEGWLPLVLLAVAMYSVVFSIIDANWVDHTSVLLWSAPAGLLAGLLVAKSRRLPQVILHVAACLGGYWLSIFLTSTVALHVPWMTLLDSLRAVITGDLTSAGASGNEMVFLFYLSFLCFFLGYLGSWLTYRAHLPWLVALAYCSITLVNLNYAKQDLSYLVIILLGALVLLIARVQLATQLEQWKSEGLYTDRPWLRAISLRCMRIASALMLLVIASGWLLPVFSQPRSGVNLWNALDNAFANIAHRHVIFQDPGSIFLPYQTPSNFFGDQLTISGSVNLPVGEVLNYTSTRAPQYLEGFTYDHFDGHTWTSTTYGSGQSYPPQVALPQASTSGAYDTALTNISIVQPPEGTKHFIFAPSEPLKFDVPTTIYGNGLTAAWTQQGPLTGGEHYFVVSSIPKATVDQLSHVAFPQVAVSGWQGDPNFALLETYALQIPDGLPPTVLKTAQAWTRGARNSYQAMQMLEAHLSNALQFTYSINNVPIPSNVDVVSWLLQTRRGYCTYYATAMTVMARLLDVPARIVSGFSQGHFDSHRHVWIVNGDDAHSWVQVYFPGQGWINFDPTPGFALSDSRGVGPGSPASPPPSTTKHPATSPANHHRPDPRLNQPAGTGNGKNSAALDAAGRQNALLGFSLVTLICSFLFLLIALCTYWWRNLYKNSSFVSGTYWRACRIASWAGFSPEQWQTPYEYSRALSRNAPHVARPLHRLTDLFVRDRWAAPHEVPYGIEEDDVERQWPHLRGTLLRMIFRRFKKE